MYIYYSLSFGVGILSLLVFFVLQWLQIPTGSLLDWLIGIACFYWLLTIVTIPWNIHFEAKEVINEAEISRQKNIPVNNSQIEYVKKLAFWSLFIAIFLHLSSTLVLYLLSAKGITSVGYLTSIASLLLTFLRPAIRGYQYLNNKLYQIKKQIKYPREDVIKLVAKVSIIEKQIKQIQDKLNLSKPESFASIQSKSIQVCENKILHISNSLQELINSNQQEHQQILRHSENAISQLTEDSQFLGHVKEIIRFVKTT